MNGFAVVYSVKLAYALLKSLHPTRETARAQRSTNCKALMFAFKQPSAQIA